MHAVARSGPMIGLVLLLFAPFGSARAVPATTTTSTAPAMPVATASVMVVGQPAPEVSFTSLHAPQDSLHLADYRGRVVYLDFWSAWCAPCRRSMPDLDALRRAYARDEFEVVGVNVDAVAADARRFLRQVPVSYPVVADSGGVIAGRFGVEVLPALVVIDAAGVVREALTGAEVEGAALRARLEQLIEEQGVR